MATANVVVLIGNLTRDVEVTFTPSGAAVAKFGLAINSSYKNRDGEKVENTDFFNIVAWNKTAELAEEYLHKGSPVYIQGRLSQRQWETDDGQKRSTVEVVANNIQFLSSKPRDEQAAPTQEPAQQPAVDPDDIDLGDDIPW